MELACQSWPSEGIELARVVLLHGMGGTGKLWRPIAASLESHHSLLAPDQRGHGGSRVVNVPGGRKPATWYPLDYGQDVVDTLESRRFAPAYVVGHSMGVRTAAAVAHLRPDFVQGLVCIDLGFSGLAGGGLGEDLAAMMRKLPDTFPSRAEAREFLTRECPDPAIAQYLMAVSDLRPEGTVGFPFDRGALIETITAARDSSTRLWIREAAQHDIPILVLRGERSLVWSEAEFEAERKAFEDLPQVRFETFPGAGHGLPFEKRAEFVARLERFISENATS